MEFFVRSIQISSLCNVLSLMSQFVRLSKLLLVQLGQLIAVLSADLIELDALFTKISSRYPVKVQLC